VRAPGMWPELWRTPLDWQLSTEPQAACDNRRHYWPRGKVLGGTSCFNAMVYMRGHRDNYDGWRDLGNPGWGWDDVLPYFKRSEDNARGASTTRGAGGPLHVSDHPAPARASSAFAAATAARCKIPLVDDFNGGEHEGAGIFQFTVRAGLRASTAAAFLDPIRDRANLTIITGATATELVLDGDRVVGVRVRTGTQEQVIAGTEIIVTGGAIGSPHLLLLSGVGPASRPGTSSPASASTSRITCSRRSPTGSTTTRSRRCRCSTTSGSSRATSSGAAARWAPPPSRAARS
jgi:choline dehydrogenase